MRYRLLPLITVVILQLSSCFEDNKKPASEAEGNAVTLHFYARIESQPDSSATRSTLSGTSTDALRKVLWEPTDSIFVTNGSASAKFNNVFEENSDMADFSGKIASSTNYYAAFPFGIVSGYNASAFLLTLPTIQPYKEDGVGSESFPMVAKCISNVFEFKNLCGILVLNLKGSATIDSIRFSGSNDTDKPIKVSGAANVNTSYTDSPVLVLDNNAVEYVILDCIGSSGKGVTLNPTKSTPFHIVLPAKLFSKFRVVFYSSDGKKMTINSDKPLTIKRSKRTTASTIEYLADKPEYEFVDLGLSVNWATCNVGAEKPEEYGDYYAWGETETKSTYDWSTYKWCKGSNRTLTKYCNKSSCGNNGFTDTKTTLDPEDDVAHVKWGGNWRMPTREEFEELLNNCTWSWTTQNGIKGYKGTSKKSGYTDCSIFLPTAGFRFDTNLYLAGSYCDYWSSSLPNIDGPVGAWHLDFSSNGESSYYSYRSRGLSVRPVCPSETWVPVTSLSLDRTSLSLETGESAKLSATARKDGDVEAPSVHTALF